MSSDKAPERLYWSSGAGCARDKEAFIDPVTYIRADLIPSDDSYVDYLKERTEYEEQKEKEAVNLIAETYKNEMARRIRKREMYEKVALRLITHKGYLDLSRWTVDAARLTDFLIQEADKFARGE